MIFLRRTAFVGTVSLCLWGCSAGPAGAAGQSALLSVQEEAAGSHCTSGGKAITTGVDKNGNGALDTDEITSTQYVCNGNQGDTGATGTAGADGAAGAAGADGSNGKSSLVRVTDEAAGASCAAGGKKIESGIDTNGDGVLQDSEVVGTATYVCNGVAGSDGAAGAAGSDGAAGSAGSNGKSSLVRVSDEAAGANCATGGKKIEVGVDANDDGVLGDEEVVASSTSYVCNGAAGSSGKSSLLRITTEDPGSNCADGGKKVEVGIDADGDGVLSDAEVDASQTTYLCSP